MNTQELRKARESLAKCIASMEVELSALRKAQKSIEEALALVNSGWIVGNHIQPSVIPDPPTNYEVLFGGSPDGKVGKKEVAADFAIAWSDLTPYLPLTPLDRKVLEIAKTFEGPFTVRDVLSRLESLDPAYWNETRRADLSNRLRRLTTLGHVKMLEGGMGRRGSVFEYARINSEEKEPGPSIVVDWPGSSSRPRS